MVWKNTPTYFAERIINEVIDSPNDKIFNTPTNGVICWLDDILLYVQDIYKIQDLLKRILKRTLRKKVLFNFKKCILFDDYAEWCGRLTKDGKIPFKDSFYNKIPSVPRPEIAHQLAQVIYLCNWLAPIIPGLAQIREPFNEIVSLHGGTLEDLEKAVVKINWTPTLEKTYELLKQKIVGASKRYLEVYDPEK
eukprot:augustus_masked-scaffold_26-processed-gene-0.9-mRNA-1 protein AED:0.38 eAED:0.42 QI:0/-1/0/1/-1/1/1/0/192